MKPLSCTGVVMIAALVLIAPAARAAEPETIALPGSHVFPESITATADGTLIIGSAGHGTLYRAAPGAATARLWIEPEASGTRSVFGVVADDARNALWACTNAPLTGDGPGPALVRFALDTGAVTGRWPLIGETPICNDIALAADGAVFVTDTLAGRILRLPTGGDALEPWYENKEALFGVDGIAFDADGRLLLTNVIGNTLLALEVTAGRPGALVTLEPSIPLGRPDSLRPIGDGRFVMTENEAGRLTTVRFTGRRAEMAVLAEGDVGVSGAVFARGALWSVNGMLHYTREPELKGKDPGPAVIRRAPLTDAAAQ